MNSLTPQELACLWYLKFGHAWIARDDLEKDWKDISRTLMQHNLAAYDLLADKQAVALEIIKLKETYQ